jgi:HD-GYP domain-containing protein (c-di-GMP phosphodiesterase class II)
MVLRIEGLGAIAPWIRHSHEHVDGSGYPRGLAGEAIPIESRLILVADAFDAMTSDRAYRRAATPEDALAELRRCAGRQFDPDCVELLAATLAEAYGEPRAAATRPPRGSSAPRTTRQATATSAMSAKPSA